MTTIGPPRDNPLTTDGCIDMLAAAGFDSHGHIGIQELGETITFTQGDLKAEVRWLAPSINFPGGWDWNHPQVSGTPRANPATLNDVPEPGTAAVFLAELDGYHHSRDPSAADPRVNPAYRLADLQVRVLCAILERLETASVHKIAAVIDRAIRDRPLPDGGKRA